MPPADVSIVTVRLHRQVPDLPQRGGYTGGKEGGGGQRLRVKARYNMTLRLHYWKLWPRIIIM